MINPLVCGLTIKAPSKRFLSITSKAFNIWWNDFGTKFNGATYDEKLPFSLGQKYWARILDPDVPCFESVPSRKQERSWFFDTVGPSIRRFQDYIISCVRDSGFLDVRNTSRTYGARELIAPVPSY